MTLGADYSAGTIAPAALLNHGISVALRYITPNLPPKTLTRSEANQLLNGGIAIGCLWETTEERMLGGAVAGHADGMGADAALIALGAPDDVTTFFAADWDVQPDQVGVCLEYMHAAAAALGRQELAGVYGGLRLVAAAADAGFRTFQTVAWSSGWDPRAAARQTGQQLSIGGITVDLDEIVDLGALGAWTPGGGPVSVPKVPPSIVVRWPFLATDFPPGAPYTDETALIWGDAGARAAAVLAQQCLDQLVALTGAVDALTARLDQSVS